MSLHWLLQEAVSQTKPVSDEYLLHPGAVSDPLPDIESDIDEDMNSPPPLIEPPLLTPSPSDATSSRSANSTPSFLNLSQYELYDVQLQNAEVTDELR